MYGRAGGWGGTLTGTLALRCQNPRIPHPSTQDCHPRGWRAVGPSPTQYRGRGRIQAWIGACRLIADGKEGKGRVKEEEKSAVKETLDVRLRAPVVDNTMNGGYTSRKEGGRSGTVLSRSRQRFGRGQTVIIVEGDGGESTSQKPICTTNPPPPFLFAPPCAPFDRHLPVGTRVRTPPPAHPG